MKPGYHLVKLQKNISIIRKPATKQNMSVSFTVLCYKGWQALKLGMPRLALSPRWITQTAKLRLETFVSYCVFLSRGSSLDQSKLWVGGGGWGGT